MPDCFGRQTLQDRAERLWTRYGRITTSGRIYLADEYLGRVGTDDVGQPFTFARGDRAIGFPGVAPVALVARHLQ